MILTTAATWCSTLAPRFGELLGELGHVLLERLWTRVAATDSASRASSTTCAPTNLEHVAPGWGCCRCQSYNGLQRLACKHCEHARCDLAPKATA